MQTLNPTRATRRDITWLRDLVAQARECCDLQHQREIISALTGALANPERDGETAVALFIEATGVFAGDSLRALAALLAPAAAAERPADLRNFAVTDISHGMEVAR